MRAGGIVRISHLLAPESSIYRQSGAGVLGGPTQARTHQKGKKWSPLRTINHRKSSHPARKIADAAAAITSSLYFSFSWRTIGSDRYNHPKYVA
jgi:hypothetical protein